MKQNLMQMQLKLSNNKERASRLTSSANNKGSETIDYTSKAFYIANEIMTSNYLFSKKALVTHLQGKPILLQQKNDERPPSTLKAYMTFQNDYLISKLLDTMIDLNILTEQRVALKKRFVKRLFTTKNFQFNNFPKVYVTNSNTKKSIELTFTPKKMQKYHQHQKAKEKSRLSTFLITKNSLTANIQKRQIQVKIKTEKQKEQELARKKRNEEQMRDKKQEQIKVKKLAQQREFELKKKQQEKQTHLTKMNAFWIQEKQKIQTFVPTDELQCNDRKNNQNQKQKIDDQCVQMAGNVLQIQMKQLKNQQQQRKNPIKSFISWGFMKQTLGIETSQNKNEIKQQIPPPILVQKEKIPTLKNSQKTQRIVQTKYETKKKLKKKQDVVDDKISFLGLNLWSQKMQIQQQQQEFSQSFVNSQSTDITMTNHKLQKKSSKDKIEEIYQKQQIFAKSPEDSMFSSSYYVLGNKGQQTITNKKDEKNPRRTPADKNQSKISLKRRSTTFEKKVSFAIDKKFHERDSSFEELKKVEEKTEIESKFNKRNRSEKEESGEMQHTITVVIPKRDSQLKTKNKKICTNDLYPIKSQYKEKETKRDSFVNELINDYYNKKSRG